MNLAWLDIVVVPCAIFGFVFALWGLFDFNSILKLIQVLFPISILIIFCYLCAIMKIWSFIKKGWCF